jgi:hypothetical protein
MRGPDFLRPMKLLAAVSLLAVAATGAYAQSNVPTPTPAPRGLTIDPPKDSPNDPGGNAANNPGADTAGDTSRGTVACPEGQVPTSIAGMPCAPAPGGAGTASVPPGAVFLPDILVDLFPWTPREPAVATDPGTAAHGGTTGGGTAAPTGGGTAAPLQVASAAGAARPLAAAPRAITGAFVPDEVLVTIEGDQPVVADLAADFGLEVRSQRLSELLGVTIARLGIPDGRPVATVLAQLAGDPRTLERVPNHIYEAQQAAAVANYAFDRIALDSKTATGANIRIAVIDTAPDLKHPALKGVIAEMYDSMPDQPISDRDHGTSVSGLIAGVGPLPGMAPGSTIYHARAFESGRSTMEILLNSLDWAASKRVRIINMSFVGPKNGLLEQAIKGARGRGMILVAAAGNNGPDAPFGYPAAYKGVIAVTATDEKDRLMEQANRGAYVYVSAPGVNLVAPVGGGQDLVTGTSFAAAIVTGAIANLLHENPERSAKWVEQALAKTSADLGPKGRDTDFGFGLINTRAAGALK